MVDEQDTAVIDETHYFFLKNFKASFDPDVALSTFFSFLISPPKKKKKIIVALSQRVFDSKLKN